MDNENHILNDIVNSILTEESHIHLSNTERTAMERIKTLKVTCTVNNLASKYKNVLKEI